MKSSKASLASWPCQHHIMRFVFLLLTDQRDRMLEDQKRYGKSAFEVVAIERLHR